MAKFREFREFDAEGNPIEREPLSNEEIARMMEEEAGLPPYEAGYEGIPRLPMAPVETGLPGALAGLPGQVEDLIGGGAERASEAITKGIGEERMRRALAQEPGGMPPVDPSEAPLGLTPERLGRGGEPRMPGRLEDIAGLPGKLAGLIEGGAEGLSSEAIDLMAKYPGLVSAEDSEAYLRGDEEFDPDSPDPSRQADYVEPDPNLDMEAQLAEDEWRGQDRRLHERMQERPPFDPEAGYDPAEMAILQRSDVHGDMDAPILGPSVEQLGLRARAKQKREAKGDYADIIRHGRRMAKEQARNSPRFWFKRTGDPKADAAMGVAMAKEFGGVLQEQIKGRTAREELIGQQANLEKALELKSDEQLTTLLTLPGLPGYMRRAILSKLGAKGGLPGAGMGGGSGLNTSEVLAEVEQDNPVLLSQIAGAFAAPDGGDLNTDIGGFGSLGDIMEEVSGEFAGTVRKTNSDQLSYMAENLAQLIASKQITPENIAMVGPIIAAKLHTELKRELGRSEDRLSRDGVAWGDIQQFMNDIISGRMPSNYQALVSPRRSGGLFRGTSR